MSNQEKDLASQLGSQTFNTSGSVDINEHKPKVTRPNIVGSGAYVTRPNTAAYIKQDEERKEAEAKAQAIAEQEKKASSPDALASQVQYLTRTVKKLEKELKGLRDAKA